MDRISLGVIMLEVCMKPGDYLSITKNPFGRFFAVEVSGTNLKVPVVYGAGFVEPLGPFATSIKPNVYWASFSGNLLLLSEVMYKLTRPCVYVYLNDSLCPRSKAS
jgi:hypothetical protein